MQAAGLRVDSDSSARLCHDSMASRGGHHHTLHMTTCFTPHTNPVLLCQGTLLAVIVSGPDKSPPHLPEVEQADVG